MNEFILNTRFQIAAVCFLIIILAHYLGNDRPQQLSTKYFNLFLVFCSVNLVFDIVTVYTVSHMDTVPLFLNNFLHKFFILSLDAAIAGLYFYVSALGNKQRRYSLKEHLVRVSPFAISAVIVIFAPIYYKEAVNGITYSYGPAANTVYASIAIYLTLIAIKAIKNRKDFRKENYCAIWSAILIWLAAAIVQLLFPTIFVSGLSIVLMILFLYLSFENPKEFIDEETGAQNKKAYEVMLIEKFESHKKFFVVNIVINDMAQMYNLLGRERGGELLSDIVVQLRGMLYTRIYRIKGNVLSMAFDGDRSIERITEVAANYFNQQWDICSNSFTVNATIHVISCPEFASDVSDLSELTGYLAKFVKPEHPDKKVFFVDKEIVELQKRSLIIREILHDAIDDDGFDVFYQPIFDTSAKTFLSAEALVRLRDTATIGFVSPDEFIPIAEKNNMIMDIGAIVFEKVCRFANENKLADKGIKYIEVNLSGVQAADANLTNQLDEMMKKFNIRPDFINLEITETVAVEYQNILQSNMYKLKQMGCSFSMDDFGTGYSNLSQMVSVNFELIKLDKSLIWPCFDNEKAISGNARIILENVVNLIRMLEVGIVAEGVETIEQVEYLTGLGVHHLQGYYFSRPLNEESYLKFTYDKIMA